MYKDDIGTKLKKYREKNNLSISDVSKKTKINESTIESIESNIRKPKLKQLKKLSNLYNIDIDGIIDSNKLLDEVLVRRKLDILEFITITILIIIFFINILSKNTNISNNIYKFNGNSEHFKFDNGIYIDGENKYIDISNFDIKDDTQYKNITINVAFNESIWKIKEYKNDGNITAKEWLQNINFNEYGDNNDSFSNYKDIFPNDFKIEFNYCTIDDKCSIEILDIKK